VFTATQAQGRFPDGLDEQQWRTDFARWTREQLLGADPDSTTSVIEVGDEPAGRLRSSPPPAASNWPAFSCFPASSATA
jgi:hypothetical protein